jgi:hypothetical protein
MFTCMWGMRPGARRRVMSSEARAVARGWKAERKGGSWGCSRACRGNTRDRQLTQHHSRYPARCLSETLTEMFMGSRDQSRTSMMSISLHMPAVAAEPPAPVG